jgi:extradiol dioxygenase
MISFYARSPSGFDIEYGTGALDIDEESWVPTLSPIPAELWGHELTDVGDSGALETIG